MEQTPVRAIASRADWRGPQEAGSSAWRHTLSTRDIDELRTVTAELDQPGLDLRTVDRTRVRLPHIKTKLDAIDEELINGRGFAMLSGLPVDQWSRREAGIAFWALGCQIGRPVAQNASGFLMDAVTDTGRSLEEPTARGYQTRAKLDFHCDSADLVVLLCLQPAKTGGASRIVSAIALHNWLAENEPHHLRTLYEPFFLDRRGEAPPGEEPYYPQAVFTAENSRVYTRYVRGFIMSAQRKWPQAASLSSAQLAALDRLDELAEDSRFRLDLDFQPGDIQFLYNYSVLHSRTDFEDYPEPERRRFLLRFWMDAHRISQRPRAFDSRRQDMAAWAADGGRVIDLPAA